MDKNNPANDGQAVSKQTLVIAIVLSIVIGFFGGTVYSSFKLAGSKAGLQASSRKMPEINVGQESQDDSAQYAAQILKLEQYLKKNPKRAGPIFKNSFSHFS